MNLFSVAVIFIGRVKHLLVEARRIPKLENTIAVLRAQHSNAIKEELLHYERIYNVNLYLLVLEYDVAILRNDALFSFRLWKKKFVARQLATLLYEASQDIPKLLGKNFRDSLASIDIDERELELFSKITKNLNKYKNDNRELLQKLRNFVGAHRDKDAAKQLEIIEEVELLNIMELTASFYENIRELSPFMIRVIVRLGDREILIRHVLASSNKI